MFFIVVHFALRIYFSLLRYVLLFGLPHFHLTCLINSEFVVQRDQFSFNYPLLGFFWGGGGGGAFNSFPVIVRHVEVMVNGSAKQNIVEKVNQRVSWTENLGCNNFINNWMGGAAGKF
ncbi:hypothetical protein ACJX0J_019741 [Zea mays]